METTADIFSQINQTMLAAGIPVARQPERLRLANWVLAETGSDIYCDADRFCSPMPAHIASAYSRLETRRQNRETAHAI